MPVITVNHVFSSGTQSQIFDDLIGYFQAHSKKFVPLKSIAPVPGALLRHYHRPNLEERLINPAVVTVHHDLADSDDWLRFERYEQQYRQADHIICLNSEQKIFLARAGIDRTSVIPHGFNQTYLRPVAHRVFNGERKLAIGVFSRRYARKVKGEAFLQELLKRLDPDKFSFLFIGQDRGQEARFARSLEFQARSYEQLPYPVLCAAYAEIDLLLIASEFEGGPANIPEALATCTPILSSRVGMAADLVQEGGNGFFLSLDADKDAAVLHDLHANPDKMTRLFAGARTTVALAISWEAAIQRHEDVYLDLVKGVLGPS